jgi:hypothetical protein
MSLQTMFYALVQEMAIKDDEAAMEPLNPLAKTTRRGVKRRDSKK